MSFHPNAYHVPVMLLEAVAALNIIPNGIYVDCTFGGGGHSREILKNLGPQGRLIVFDQDAAAQTNLPEDKRVQFVASNFRHLERFLRFYDAGMVNGILADLGISSHQIDEASRGFSTRFDAALDMRMDQRATTTAAQVLAERSEEELQQIFSRYGEVTNAKTLAAKIAAVRQVQPIRTISGFKEAISDVVKGNPHKYFAQVFQALRIEVNEELKVLEELLEQTAAVLAPKGRLAVITFHSLEDRIVKNFMKTGSVAEMMADDIYGTRPKNPFNVITKKPVEASKEEQKQNPRSRSAKLRIAEKT